MMPGALLGFFSGMAQAMSPEAQVEQLKRRLLTKALTGQPLSPVEAQLLNIDPYLKEKFDLTQQQVQSEIAARQAATEQARREFEEGRLPLVKTQVEQVQFETGQAKRKTELEDEANRRAPQIRQLLARGDIQGALEQAADIYSYLPADVRQAIDAAQERQTAMAAIAPIVQTLLGGGGAPALPIQPNESPMAASQRLAAGQGGGLITDPYQAAMLMAAQQPSDLMGALAEIVRLRQQQEAQFPQRVQAELIQKVLSGQPLTAGERAIAGIPSPEETKLKMDELKARIDNLLAQAAETRARASAILQENKSAAAQAKATADIRLRAEELRRAKEALLEPYKLPTGIGYNTKAIPPDVAQRAQWLDQEYQKLLQLMVGSPAPTPQPSLFPTQPQTGTSGGVRVRIIKSK